MKQFANEEDKTVSFISWPLRFLSDQGDSCPKGFNNVFIGGCRPAADGVGRQLFPERVFLRRNPNTKACSKANQTVVRSLMASVRSPEMTLILLKTIVAVYSRVTLMKRCYLFVSSVIQKNKKKFTGQVVFGSVNFIPLYLSKLPWY